MKRARAWALAAAVVFAVTAPGGFRPAGGAWTRVAAHAASVGEGAGGGGGASGADGGLSWRFAPEGNLLELTGQDPPQGRYASEAPPWEAAYAPLVERIYVHGGLTSAAFLDLARYPALKEAAFGDTVAELPAGAFAGLSGLERVSFGAGVRSLPPGAFEGCASLASVRLPDELAAVPYACFKGCVSLARVEVPDGVAAVEEFAFEGCAALAEVYVPATLVTFARNALQGSPATICGYAGTGAERLAADAGAPYAERPAAVGGAFGEGGALAWSYDGAERVLTITGAGAIPDCAAADLQAEGGGWGGAPWQGVRSKVARAVVGAGVTAIGANAFYGCARLQALEFAEPAAVTSIGAGAFSGCASLGALAVPPSVAYIGEGAFEGRGAALTLLCEPGSYAEGYAAARGIPVAPAQAPAAPGQASGGGGGGGGGGGAAPSATTARPSPTASPTATPSPTPSPTPPPSAAPPPAEAGDGLAEGDADMLSEAPLPDVALPLESLGGVGDAASASAAIDGLLDGLGEDQKRSSLALDKVSLFVEEAVARAGAIAAPPGAGIVIDGPGVAARLAQAREAREAAGRSLAAHGLGESRALRAEATYLSTRSDEVEITVDPSADGQGADSVRVVTPGYVFTLSAEAIRSNVEGGALVITIRAAGGEGAPALAEGAEALGGAAQAAAVWEALSKANAATPYTVTFNKAVEEPVKASLPALPGDTDYQAVVNSVGDPVGGKLNPATGLLEAKLAQDDTYVVKENRKGFSDVSGKSKEMQEAISVLASKGIIKGTSDTEFSPDDAINRAEITALVMRTLSKVKQGADGGFRDVKKSDWFFSAVGSAKKYGVVYGTSATTFEPYATIRKDQIVAIAARTLKMEMGYSAPSDPDKYLGAYADSRSIPSWGRADIALATRENLVPRRSDGKFSPASAMSRGSAAVIMYRMFKKVW